MQWPVTRDFVRVAVPDDERRHTFQLATASFRAVIMKQSKFKSSSPISDLLPIKHQVIANVLMQNNSLESRKRVFALVDRDWKEILSSPPTE